MGRLERLVNEPWFRKDVIQTAPREHLKQGFIDACSQNDIDILALRCLIGMQGILDHQSYDCYGVEKVQFPLGEPREVLTLTLKLPAMHKPGFAYDPNALFAGMFRDFRFAGARKVILAPSFHSQIGYEVHLALAGHEFKVLAQRLAGSKRYWQCDTDDINAIKRQVAINYFLDPPMASKAADFATGKAVLPVRVKTHLTKEESDQEFAYWRWAGFYDKGKPLAWLSLTERFFKINDKVRDACLQTGTDCIGMLWLGLRIGDECHSTFPEVRTVDYQGSAIPSVTIRSADIRLPDEPERLFRHMLGGLPFADARQTGSSLVFGEKSYAALVALGRREREQLFEPIIWKRQKEWARSSGLGQEMGVPADFFLKKGVFELKVIRKSWLDFNNYGGGKSK